MEKIEKLLIATGNPGKVREFEQILGDHDVVLVGLNSMGDIPGVEETGGTFSKNAILKASGYAQRSGCWTLADDSGLEVSGLGGRPGVMSARFGGDGLDDAQRMELLLREMAVLEGTDRAARFVCSIAIANPAGDIVCLEEGECRGIIARSPLGMGGFGYDPIFKPDGFERTFAELDSHEKESLSHRGLATKKILSSLARMGLL